MDPRLLTSIGLGMDIVGIVLLFRFGAIGGAWIDRPTAAPPMVTIPDGVDDKDDEIANAALRDTERNHRRARCGAFVGLLLAVVGFALQIVAQWL